MVFGMDGFDGSVEELQEPAGGAGFHQVIVDSKAVGGFGGAEVVAMGTGATTLSHEVMNAGRRFKVDGAVLLGVAMGKFGFKVKSSPLEVFVETS